MNQQSKLHNPCRAYRGVAAQLLELPADDPARQVWSRHADSCQACKGLLEADGLLVARLAHLPVPEPAFVRGRVMNTIRSSRRPTPFHRRDFVWGAASAFAGIVIGLLIASANPNSYAQVTESSEQEEFAGIVADSFDELAVDLTVESGEAR